MNLNLNDPVPGKYHNYFTTFNNINGYHFVSDLNGVLTVLNSRTMASKQTGPNTWLFYSNKGETK